MWYNYFLITLMRFNLDIKLLFTRWVKSSKVSYYFKLFFYINGLYLFYIFMRRQSTLIRNGKSSNVTKLSE